MKTKYVMEAVIVDKKINELLSNIEAEFGTGLINQFDENSEVLEVWRTLRDFISELLYGLEYEDWRIENSEYLETLDELHTELVRLQCEFVTSRAY